MHKDAVLDAMKDWENKTGFIKFKSSVNSYWEDVWRNTDHFWILNIKDKDLGEGRGGNSTVGYQVGMNNLYLNSNKNTNVGKDIPENLYRVTRHELGHAIGLSKV